MMEVRNALRESLELPTRHAKLVAKAPLRLRTGPCQLASSLSYLCWPKFCQVFLVLAVF